MRKSVAIMFSALFIVVLLVWAVFYLIVSNQIYAEAETRIDLAANQVMDNLGAEFAELERVSHMLSGNPSVLQFTQELDTSAYYLLADEISALVDNTRINTEFVDNIIIFGKDGSFFRFSGKLSNTSCARVGYLAGLMASPEHMAVRLEYQNYIGYVSPITDDAGMRSGALVMLVEEEKLLELIGQSAMGDSLLVSILGGGEVVASNTPDTANVNVEYTVTRHIGLTSFEITVSADENVLTASTYYFSIAAAVTVLIFGLLIAVFIRQMNKRFLSPMLRVMNDVEALDWTERGSHLPSVQNEEFDNLIDRINDMLLRIEGQSDEIIAAQLQAKNAELQKQKAIIFSLKRQINAHFVINTLSAIRILLEQNEVEQAGIITNDLSSLIRYAYEKDDMIGFWDELQMLGRYVSIMNVRYANKIDVIFDVDDRLMDVLIPRMLLQPIVENAILHGFKNRREGCEIRIEAAITDKRIMITIRDNGVGMETSQLDKLNKTLASFEADLPEGIESIALINIKHQLYAHYGKRASLNIQSTQKQGTSVVLTTPYSVVQSV